MASSSGLLLVHKPSGPTSHDVVARVRRIVGTRKVGHAGTLDPFASGLLLVLVGPSTRLAEYLLKLDKSYEAGARLGVETDSHDLQGEVVSTSDDWKDVTPQEISSALAGFDGEILQRPPALSAKKVGGESAHRRVRRGEELHLEPVPVTIHEIRLLDPGLPTVRFRVRCSSGTYIRALARDLGRALGVGAHLTELVRTGIGDFSLEDAFDLEELEELEEGGEAQARLISPARALAHLPAVQVEAGEARRLRQGQFVPLPAPEPPQGGPLRVLLGEELLGIGEAQEGLLKPRKVLSG